MKQIRVYREAAGMTQKELARRIGIASPSLCKMEKPGNYPDARRLPDIADALACSIDALYGREQVGRFQTSPPSGGEARGADDSDALYGRNTVPQYSVTEEGGDFHGA